MNTWPHLQQEISTWALHNFGVQGAWQPMLGLFEEVGEFIAHRENPTLPSKTYNIPELEDALADQTIYALNLCEICGINFGPDIAIHSSPEFLSDAQILGALAAASRAVLKEAQGIRGYDQTRRRDEMIVALTLWFRWASAQHLTFKLKPILECTSNVWMEVRRRDWRKNPTNANKVAASEKQGMAIRLTRDTTFYESPTPLPGGSFMLEDGTVIHPNGFRVTFMPKVRDDLAGGK